MWNLKKKLYKSTYLQSRKRLTENTLMVARVGGGGQGEGTVKEFGMDMYTLLYLKWIANKDPLYSTWNSDQCYVVAWMRGEFGGQWMYTCVCVCVCVCMAEFLHCSPETMAILLDNWLYLNTKLKVSKRILGINTKEYSKELTMWRYSL